MGATRRFLRVPLQRLDGGGVLRARVVRRARQVLGPNRRQRQARYHPHPLQLRRQDPHGSVRGPRRPQVERRPGRLARGPRRATRAKAHQRLPCAGGRRREPADGGGDGDARRGFPSVHGGLAPGIARSVEARHHRDQASARGEGARRRLPDGGGATSSSEQARGFLRTRASTRLGGGLGGG